jgi:hypothetical protein
VHVPANVLCGGLLTSFAQKGPAAARCTACRLQNAVKNFKEHAKARRGQKNSLGQAG